MFAPFILALDFMNFTYHVNPCGAEDVPPAVPIVMRKGGFAYSNDKMGTGFSLFIRAVKEGSLRPGTRQAVVVMTCEYPIGGEAAAYAFDERPKGLVYLGKVGSASWGGDWGRGPESIAIRFANGELNVTQCVFSNACNKGTKTVVYALRGSSLTTVRVTEAVALRTEEAALAAEDRVTADFKHRDYRRAVIDATAGLAFAKDKSSLYERRAQAYEREGEHARAIADYTSAIRARPHDTVNNAPAYANRAAAYAAWGKLAQAEADYGRAVQALPTATEYLCARAEIKEREGKLDGALADYNAGITLLAAKLVDAAAGLKWVLTNPRTGSIDEARYRREYDKLDENQAMARAQARRAVVYYRLGRFADASADVDAALTKNSKLADALFVRGLLKRRRGDAAGANADIAAAQRVDRNVGVTLLRDGVR